MATHDIKLKKYVAGTTNAWEDAYPETTHTQIIATGTADSTTFLRGDGAWAVPAGSTTAGSAEKVTLQVRFGEAVSKGDPVYISGYHGSTGPVIMSKAKANDSAKMPAFGLADDDYAENATGYAVSIGILEDVDTDSYTVGDTLYVAPTGGLTDTKPTGSNLIQNVGTVSRSNLNNGSIEVTATGRSNDVPNLTTGKLWVGSANNTIESATLHLDETNNRLGIGTNSPSSKLHIFGADPILTIQDTETAGASSDARLRLAESGASNVLDQYWDFKKEGHNLKFQQKYGTTVYDRFTINGTNGNVGIGTTSPSEKLHIAGDVQIDGSGSTIGGSTLANGWLKIGTSLSMDNNEIYFGTQGYIGTIGAHNLLFMHNSSEKAKVVSGGFDVTGNITVSGTVDGVDIAAFKTAYDSHTHTTAEIYEGTGTTQLFTNAGTSSPKLKIEYLPDAVFDSLYFQASFAMSGNNVTNTNNLTNVLQTAMEHALTNRKSASALKGYYFVTTTSAGTINDVESTDTAKLATNASGSYSNFYFRWDWNHNDDAQSSTDGSNNNLSLYSSGYLEIGDWFVVENVFGSGTSSDPYYIHFSIVQNTYEVMVGASEGIGPLPDTAGSKGLVPSPGATDYDKFLRGDGTWTTDDTKVSKSGDTMTGNLKFTDTSSLGISNVTGDAHIRVNDTYGNVHIQSKDAQGVYVDTDNFNIRERGNTSNTVFYTNLTNVGIGTTSPTSKLDVAGQTTITNSNDGGILLKFNTDRPWQFLNTGSGAGSSLNLDSTTNGKTFNIRSSNANELASFYSGDSTSADDNRVWLLPDGGRVGIGTTTPGSPLTVVGTIESLPVSTSEGGDLRLKAATGKSYQYTIDNYNDTLRFIRQDDATGTNGQVRMLIDSSGKVGIGTTTPTGKLNIVDDTTRGLEFEEITGGIMRMLAYDRTNSTYETLRINGSDLEFRVGTNTAMVVDADGDVGIGTTSPGKKLEVAGTSYVNQTGGGDSFLANNTANYTVLKSDFNGARSWQIDNVGGKVQWYMDGTADEYLFNMTTDGKVGIGTTSPAYKLDVSGTARISSTVKMLAGTNYNENLRMSASTNDYSSIAFGADSSTDTGTQTGQWTLVRYPATTHNNKFSLRHSSNDVMTLLTSGNVGIGTGSPGAKLDVNGNVRIGGDATNTDLLVVHRNSTSTEIVTLRNDEAGMLFRMYGDYSNDGTTTELQARVGLDGNNTRFGNYTSSDLRLTTNNTDRLTIDSSGDVGIGTTSPAEKLEVNGTFKAGGFTATDSDEWPNFYWLRGTAGWDEGLIKGSSSRGVFGRAHFGIHFDDDRSFAFHTSSWDTEMEINGDGKIYMKGPVGIGTSSPGSSLDVAGDIQANRYYDRNDTTYYVDPASTSNINNLTVQGNLTVNGTTTTMNTTVTSTDQWTVTNAGTDVAAIINQTGSADILDVQDNGTSVFKVKDGGDVEMKTDSKFTVGASTTVNEAKIILDASNAGHPQIGLAENNDASWALGIDDGDNSFKIHGAASSTIPTIGGLATPHLELDTTGNLWLQKRIYLTSNAFIEYNSTNDSIDFFFN